MQRKNDVLYQWRVDASRSRASLRRGHDWTSPRTRRILSYSYVLVMSKCIKKRTKTSIRRRKSTPQHPFAFPFQIGLDNPPSRVMEFHMRNIEQNDLEGTSPRTWIYHVLPRLAPTVPIKPQGTARSCPCLALSSACRVVVRSSEENKKEKNVGLR